jgi:hypothetical protein
MTSFLSSREGVSLPIKIERGELERGDRGELGCVDAPFNANLQALCKRYFTAPNFSGSVILHPSSLLEDFFFLRFLAFLFDSISSADFKSSMNSSAFGVSPGHSLKGARQ